MGTFAGVILGYHIVTIIHMEMIDKYTLCIQASFDYIIYCVYVHVQIKTWEMFS